MNFDHVIKWCNRNRFIVLVLIDKKYFHQSKITHKKLVFVKMRENRTSWNKPVYMVYILMITKQVHSYLNRNRWSKELFIFSL